MMKQSVIKKLSGLYRLLITFMIGLFICYLPLFGYADVDNDLENHDDAISINIVISAKDGQRSMYVIQSTIEKKGGYLQRSDSNTLLMQLPKNGSIESVLHTIRNQGVIHKSQTSRNHKRQQIEDLSTTITVKQQHLQKLYQLYDDAAFQQTLELEQEINRVIEELEGHKGRLRQLQQQTAYIQLQIAFGHQQVRTLPSTTSIPWVNKLNIEDFLQEFSKADKR